MKDVEVVDGDRHVVRVARWIVAGVVVDPKSARVVVDDHLESRGVIEEERLIDSVVEERGSIVFDYSPEHGSNLINPVIDCFPGGGGSVSG